MFYLTTTLILQECIPLGCAPPACYRIGGSLSGGGGLPNRAPLDRHPPDRDSQRPPGQRSPWTESPRDPWTETLPDRDSQRPPGQRLSETPGQRPPGQRPAEQRPPWRDPPSHVTCGECRDRDAPPRTEFLTHVCENITLPQLRCGR